MAVPGLCHTAGPGWPSSRGVQASQAVAFLVAPGVQSTGCVAVAWGLVAPQHVGSSRTRDRTRVSCTSRCLCYHGATREALLSLGQKYHVGVGKTCTFSGPRPQISEPRTGSHLSMFYWALQAVRCMPGFENPWSASVPVSCVQKAGLPPAVSHFTGPPGSSRPVPQRWVFTSLEPPLP